jgi:hypothetical protein
MRPTIFATRSAATRFDTVWANSGRRAPEYPGHGLDTRTLQMQACNGLAFFRLQLLLLSSFVHCDTLYETGVAFHF